MTDASTVTCELDGPVATITIDDGKANVMNEAVHDELNAALDRAEAAGAVVLLRGREGMFSAGYDKAIFGTSREQVARTLLGGGGLVARLAGFPRPVVVACTGHAIAQGAFLLMAGDTRVGAAGPFRYGINEVALGLTLPHYAVEITRLRLTPAHFNRAATTGFFYDPEEALRAGFVDRLVAPGEVLAAAQAEALALAAIDPSAHVGTKERVRGAAVERMRAGVEEEFGEAAVG